MIENPKSQKPFYMDGEIAANFQFYNASGIPQRQSLLTSIFSINATAHIYDVEIPFSIVYSDNDRNYSQPFNQFGLSPRYKWITVHAGYRNLFFSNYTLAGHTVLGGGVELNPGLLRFAFIYGQFERKTTTNLMFTGDNLPRFSRNGFAAKIGIGNSSNFIDLICLKVSDDSTSFKRALTPDDRTPEQNFVAGFNNRFTIKKKLTFEAEGALSVYTIDTRDLVKVESVTDPYFVGLSKLMTINYSSEYYSAFRTALQYKERYWSLKTEYKRIEPNYRSMGAYYINNDLENITVTPSAILFKRKLNISASAGFQNDNIRGSKGSTSYRNIYALNTSYNPTQTFGISVNYSNYGLRQKDGRVAINDTVRVYQTSQNLTLMPSLYFANDQFSHNIILMYNLSDLTDNNKIITEYTQNLQYTSHLVQLNYIFGLVPSQWSFTGGANYLTYNNVASKMTNAGFMFGLSKSFLNNNLNFYLNNSLLQTTLSQTNLPSQTTNILTSSFSCNYKINKHNTLRANIYFIGNFATKSSASNITYNEMKGELRYAYIF